MAGMLLIPVNIVKEAWPTAITAFAQATIHNDGATVLPLQGVHLSPGHSLGGEGEALNVGTELVHKVCQNRK